MATTTSDNPPAPLALLAISAGPRIGEELPVPSPRTGIGSGAQNELVIQDDSISKTHALLEYTLGAWRLTDLDSTNGTFVEGVRLAPNVPTPLQYGATVRLGGLRLQFRAADGSDPEAAQAAYTPPEPAPRVAERRPGFRMPVWLALVLLLVVVTVAVAVFSWMQQSADPAVQPAPVEQAAPVAEPAPRPVAPAAPGTTGDTGLVAPPAEDEPAADTAPAAPATEP